MKTQVNYLHQLHCPKRSLQRSNLACLPTSPQRQNSTVFVFLQPKPHNFEPGMASVLAAGAITVVTLLALLVVQYLSAPSQLSRTQNYADLTAVSAAQLIQNGVEMERVCARVSQLVTLDSAEKISIEECKIDGEIAQITAKYIQTLPFLARPILAQSRAGPVD